MKTFVRMIVVLLLLAIVLGGIFGWKYLQMQKMGAEMAKAQPPTPVEGYQLEKTSWRPELKSVGSLRAINGVDVANEVAGVVDDIAFESGQSVSKGDVLITLEDSVDRAALTALQAQAQLTNETFRRFSDLLPRNAISKSQYDEAKANYQAARADVSEQQAMLNKKTVRAPFDGIVGLRQVDLGEYIAIGTPVVALNMLDPIYVDYSVPEKQLDRVHPGGSIEVHVAAYPDAVFNGEILAVAPSVDENSRTIVVRAKLGNADHRLRPGMFADVRTLAAKTDSVFTLPRTALSFNTYGDYVFRIVENAEGQTIASRTQVTTGRNRGDQVEVISGLKAGDRVVATGLLRLRDGQPVELTSGKTPESQGAEPDTGTEKRNEDASEGARG